MNVFYISIKLQLYFLIHCILMCILEVLNINAKNIIIICDPLHIPNICIRGCTEVISSIGFIQYLIQIEDEKNVSLKKKIFYCLELDIIYVFNQYFSYCSVQSLSFAIFLLTPLSPYYHL